MCRRGKARLAAALGHREGVGAGSGPLEAAGLCHGTGALLEAQELGEEPAVHVSTKGILSWRAGRGHGHIMGDNFHTPVSMSLDSLI